VQDSNHYADTGVNWRVAEGYGTVIAAQAAGLPIRLNCPVTLIDHRGKRLAIETALGTVMADAVIVTSDTTHCRARDQVPAGTDGYNKAKAEEALVIAGSVLGSDRRDELSASSNAATAMLATENRTLFCTKARFCFFMMRRTLRRWQRLIGGLPMGTGYGRNGNGRQHVH
jgi:hypothetical protein